MRAGSAIGSAVGHVVGVGLQALVLAAIIATAALAASGAFKPASELAGVGSAYAAKPASGYISVAGPVSHGGVTTATVNPGGSGVYVFVRCYAPGLDGAYVYAAYSPVGPDRTAEVGPLRSSLWTSGGAACVAEEGYFTRNGFGRWVISASTTFTVTP